MNEVNSYKMLYAHVHIGYEYISDLNLNEINKLKNNFFSAR